MIYLPTELTRLIINYLPNSRVLLYLINQYLLIYNKTKLNLAKDIIDRDKALLNSYANINFTINTINSNNNYKNKPYYQIDYSIVYTKPITNAMLIDLISYIFKNNLIEKDVFHILDLDHTLRKLKSRIRITTVNESSMKLYSNVGIMKDLYYEISIVNKILT